MSGEREVSGCCDGCSELSCGSGVSVTEQPYSSGEVKYIYKYHADQQSSDPRLYTMVEKFSGAILFIRLVPSKMIGWSRLVPGIC